MGTKKNNIRLIVIILFFNITFNVLGKSFIFTGDDSGMSDYMNLLLIETLIEDGKMNIVETVLSTPEANICFKGSLNYGYVRIHRFEKEGLDLEISDSDICRWQKILTQKYNCADTVYIFADHYNYAKYKKNVQDPDFGLSNIIFSFKSIKYDWEKYQNKKDGIINFIKSWMIDIRNRRPENIESEYNQWD